MKMKKVKSNERNHIHQKWYEKRLIFKSFVCLIYLIVITILIVCIYQLYNEKEEILPWSQVESVDDYSYITISRMSEKFAYYQDSNKEIHFVIEQEDTGLWHTYLIAIDADDCTTEVPEPVKVYGYPVVIDDELRQLAIQNIVNFVPAENEVVITNENFNTYLTNSYLDTTIPQREQFSVVLCIVIIILIIVLFLFILTLFDRDKIVYQKVEDAYHKKKKMFSIRK